MILVLNFFLTFLFIFQPNNFVHSNENNKYKIVLKKIRKQVKNTSDLEVICYLKLIPRSNFFECTTVESEASIFDSVKSDYTSNNDLIYRKYVNVNARAIKNDLKTEYNKYLLAKQIKRNESVGFLLLHTFDFVIKNLVNLYNESELKDSKVLYPENETHSDSTLPSSAPTKNKSNSLFLNEVFFRREFDNDAQYGFPSPIDMNGNYKSPQVNNGNKSESKTKILVQLVPAEHFYLVSEKVIFRKMSFESPFCFYSSRKDFYLNLKNYKNNFFVRSFKRLTSSKKIILFRFEAIAA